MFVESNKKQHNTMTLTNITLANGNNVRIYKNTYADVAVQFTVKRGKKIIGNGRWMPKNGTMIAFEGIEDMDERAIRTAIESTVTTLSDYELDGRVITCANTYSNRIVIYRNRELIADGTLYEQPGIISFVTASNEAAGTFVSN